MELATALHHSAEPVVVGPSEGEVRETYDALRRLGVPPEPEAQDAAATWLLGLLSWWCRR